MDYEENEKGSIRPDGIVMIVLASIGILIVVTTITCLFVTSKKRNRVESRLEVRTIFISKHVYGFFVVCNKQKSFNRQNCQE